MQREEIAELRHNEIIYGIVGIMLVLFFCIGGLIIGTQKVVRYEMRGQTLYEITEYPHKDLGIFMAIIGLAIGLPFLIVAQYYSEKRKRLLRSMG